MTDRRATTMPGGLVKAACRHAPSSVIDEARHRCDTGSSTRYLRYRASPGALTGPINRPSPPRRRPGISPSAASPGGSWSACTWP